MDGISLLETAICDHPFLKVEDRNVVVSICNKIRISDDPGSINVYFREQVDAESAITYLLNRYISLIEKLNQLMNKHRAEVFLGLGDKTEEGYKWTKQSKEERLIATDSKYLSQLDQMNKAENLINLLKGLNTIVFNRDRKLEQLSINYRREFEADKRH